MNRFVSLVLFCIATLFILHGQQAYSNHNQNLQIQENERQLNVVKQYVRNTEP